MKNVLKLLLSYFLVLLIGCIVGTIIVSEFFTTLHLVVGRKQDFFSARVMLESLIVVIPIILIICPMMVCFYISRHNFKKVSTVITYIILSLVTWIVLFPTYLTFSQKFSKSISQYFVKTSSAPNADVLLSSGYFRKDGRFIYYHIDNELSGTETDAVLMNMDGTNQTNMIRETHDASEMLGNQSFPFNDVLIRDALAFPLLPTFFNGYINILSNAHAAWNSGIFSWIFFALFGAALCSVYAFVGMSSWKIINSIAIFFWTAIIVVLNGSYYSILSHLIQIPRLPGFLADVENAPLALANFLICFIFLILGIISVVRHSANERNEA